MQQYSVGLGSSSNIYRVLGQLTGSRSPGEEIHLQRWVRIKRRRLGCNTPLHVFEVHFFSVSNLSQIVLQYVWFLFWRLAALRLCPWNKRLQFLCVFLFPWKNCNAEFFFFLLWSRLYCPLFSLTATRSLTESGKTLQSSATKQKCQCLFPRAWEEHRNCPQIHLLPTQQSKGSSGELLQSLPACCAGCLGSGAWGIVSFPVFAQFESLRASGRNLDSHSGSARNLQQQLLSLGSTVGELFCSSPLYLP